MAAVDCASNQEVSVLYTNHHGWLYDWLRRRLGCSDNAADLAHDTYLRVIDSGRYPTQETARSYLMQIAKGLVIDKHRRKAIEQAYIDVLATHAEILSPSAEERMLALEALCQIDAALGKLKPKIREAFILSQFDGLTYSAIAIKLNVSVASIKNYMYQALEACLISLESTESCP